MGKSGDMYVNYFYLTIKYHIMMVNNFKLFIIKNCVYCKLKIVTPILSYCIEFQPILWYNKIPTNYTQPLKNLRGYTTVINSNYWT